MCNLSSCLFSTSWNVLCRGQHKYENFLSKGYAQTAISTKVR